MTALLGLLGVLIGSGISVFGQWLTTTYQRGQAREERASRLADARRAAYNEYVRSYLRLRDQMREINDADRDHVRVSRLKPAYEETWRLCCEARASVYVAGPRSVMAACRDFHMTLGTLMDVYDRWLKRLEAEADGGAKAQWPEQDHDAAYDEVTVKWNTFLHEIEMATS
jgi:hypothetical protein